MLFIREYWSGILLAMGGIMSSIHPEKERHRLRGHVLVADDTESLRLLLQRMLEGMGLTVTAVSDGLEALNHAKSESYGLILMDMQMPNMDGVEATRQLRLSGNSTPILALTGNAMRKHRVRFQLAGCDGFLEKPVDRDELEKSVAEMLNTSHSTSSTPPPATAEALEEMVSQEASPSDMSKGEEEMIEMTAKLLHDFGNYVMAIKPFVQDLAEARSQLEQLSGVLHKQQKVADEGGVPRVSLGQLGDVMSEFVENYLGQRLDNCSQAVDTMTERLRTQRQIIKDRSR